MGEGFTTFDHTGDLGLEVWAAEPRRLYELAAQAVMAQVACPRTAADDVPEVHAEVDLTGSDAADLLVHWLNTAILQADLHHAVWTRAEVRLLTVTALRGTLSGPRLDRERLEFLREIKAVSHHFLELELGREGSRCRLILDL